MIRFLAASLALALSLGAQSATPACPHMDIRVEPGRIDFGALLDCAGATITLGESGVDISTRRRRCPATVTVTPQRDVPVHRPGCFTMVTADGFAQVITYHYECDTDHVLWFIPVGSTCRYLRSEIVARLHTYKLVGCPSATPEPSAAITGEL